MIDAERGRSQRRMSGPSIRIGQEQGKAALLIFIY